MDIQAVVDEGKLPETVSEAVSQLRFELCSLIGLSSSVRCIGLELPATALENDDVLCPELVFPALAIGLLEKGNRSLSIIERLEDLLSEQTINRDKTPL